MARVGTTVKTQARLHIAGTCNIELQVSPVAIISSLSCHKHSMAAVKGSTQSTCGSTVLDVYPLHIYDAQRVNTTPTNAALV
jgi:hypothetical protein